MIYLIPIIVVIVFLLYLLYQKNHNNSKYAFDFGPILVGERYDIAREQLKKSDFTYMTPLNEMTDIYEGEIWDEPVMLYTYCRCNVYISIRLCFALAMNKEKSIEAYENYFFHTQKELNSFSIRSFYGSENDLPQRTIVAYDSQNHVKAYVTVRLSESKTVKGWYETNICVFEMNLSKKHGILNDNNIPQFSSLDSFDDALVMIKNEVFGRSKQKMYEAFANFEKDTQVDVLLYLIHICRAYETYLLYEDTKKMEEYLQMVLKNNVNSSNIVVCIFRLLSDVVFKETRIS
ncbi:MAG: hypothetical protein VZQ98_17715 [Bacteroidales bacterium]|nr:hypothetical protein [Bacteroidales bacterium]